MQQTVRDRHTSTAVHCDFSVFLLGVPVGKAAKYKADRL
jgi:hypothetical protein